MLRQGISGDVFSQPKPDDWSQQLSGLLSPLLDIELHIFLEVRKRRDWNFYDTYSYLQKQFWNLHEKCFLWERKNRQS